MLKTRPAFPIALGGNVFGWTANRHASFQVLDRYADAGGDLIDTADSYSFWAPGNGGGESEAIVGAWLAGSGRPEGMRIASKAGQLPSASGLEDDTVRRALTASLGRLGVPRIDLYYAHFDDEARPIEDIARTFSNLREEGLIGEIGVSNFSTGRIEAWLDACERFDLHRPSVIQKQYSLLERAVEQEVVPLALRERLGILTYYSLARGYLTGKYRGTATVDSPRADAARAYGDDRGMRVLDELERVGRRHDRPMTSIALAWLLTRPSVSAVIASARSVEQLDAVTGAAEVRLTAQEVDALTAASEV